MHFFSFVYFHCFPFNLQIWISILISNFVFHIFFFSFFRHFVLLKTSYFCAFHVEDNSCEMKLSYWVSKATNFTRLNLNRIRHENEILSLSLTVEWRRKKCKIAIFNLRIQTVHDVQFIFDDFHFKLLVFNQIIGQNQQLLHLNQLDRYIGIIYMTLITVTSNTAYFTFMHERYTQRECVVYVSTIFFYFSFSNYFSCVFCFVSLWLH